MSPLTEYDTDYVCDVCEQILCAEGDVLEQTFDSTVIRTIETRHATLKEFRKAVDDGCYLCLNIWNDDTKYWEALDEDTWLPMCFRVQQPRMDQRPYGVVAVPYIGTNSRARGTEFTLLPLDDKPLGDDPLTEIESSTSSVKTLDLALSWLNDCLSSHDTCTTLPSKTPGWLPTRLIYIGLSNETQWRLLVTAEDLSQTPPPAYMTLSYRWGTTAQFLLLSSNIQSFRQGKPIAELPKTFRDLTVVARHFGIRYLWIDCLCIMQDSTEDWEAEAPSMRHVYANTTCTIAASASEDPDGGLFRTRDPKRIYPGIVNSALTTGQLEKHFIFDSAYWATHLKQGTLQTRGWVFQERLLSPRLLYFTENQVMWECANKHRCEAFPNGVPHYQPRMKQLFNETEKTAEDLAKGGRISDARLRQFGHLVHLYSELKLTRPEDRLAAFAGVAKLFQEITGDTYLGGMWQSRILDQLFWRRTIPGPRVSTRYRAPSWSWASLDGPVMLHYGYEPGKGEILIDLVDLNVAASNGDPTFDLAHGSIKLRGPFFTAWYYNTEDQLYIKPKRGKIRPFPSTYWEDSLDDAALVGSGKTQLLIYSREPAPPGWGETNAWISCFVLERAGGEDGVFRRTGVITFQDMKGDRLFQALMSKGVEDRVVTIV